MDVNCGTLPSPPTSLCPPYPSMFHHPPSPSDLGFYSAAAAHHSAFPFMAAAAASSVAGSQLNPVVSQPSQMSNTLGKSFLTASFIQTFGAFSNSKSVIGDSSDGHQAVISWSSDGRQMVIRKSSDSH